jgi:hypothetical protein
MSLAFLNCFIQLILISILTNINLITGKITYYEFCYEINTTIKISCSYFSAQNNFYSFNGNYSQITSSNSAGYTTTTNFTAGINYFEIKNLNTRDRKIEAETGTTTGSIRCE